jgi:thiamine-monophosphate kinase
VATLKEVGERALIDRIVGNIRRSAHLGPGDDAACVNINGSKIVLCTDIVTFEKHRVKEMTMREFGWFAAAVNFSDLASMGARPIGILAAVSLPPHTDEEDLYEIMKGMDECAASCGADILGGDTKSGPGSVCGTAVGVCDHRLLTRRGAEPGDLVAVTGKLGSAAAGWYAALNGIDEKEAIGAAKRPVPRVREGIFLAETGMATSCMDISDGLSATASAICGGGNTGMNIHWERLPKGAGVDSVCRMLGLPERHIMLDCGGEYELMFTFPREHLNALRSSFIDLSVIGEVTEGGCALIVNGTPEPMENKGYEHFTKG